MPIHAKTHRKVWMALLLPFVLAAAFLLLTPGTARTCTIYQRCGSEVFYYSDSSRTIQVGYRSWDCDCDFYAWGTTSNYWEWYALPCCG